MKRTIVIFIIPALISCTTYASFSQFVRVAPGVAKKPSYLIRHNSAFSISSYDQDTFLVTIPLMEPSQTNKQYWVILSTSPLKADQLNFREYVWEYEGSKGLIQMIENHEKLNKKAKTEAIKKYAPKSRSDVEEIERIIISKESKNIVLKIPKSEIERTYLYNDYPSTVMDGGYYYCYDLPAYFKQKQAEPVK